MGLRHDLRHGLRILRRSPGFTAAAVRTLAALSLLLVLVAIAACAAPALRAARVDPAVALRAE